MKNYRIVREENVLTGKILYYIEMENRGWLFGSSWTRDLGLDKVYGPVGAPTLSGAKYKLEQIKNCGGNPITSEVV